MVPSNTVVPTTGMKCILEYNISRHDDIILYRYYHGISTDITWYTYVSVSGLLYSGNVPGMKV